MTEVSLAHYLTLGGMLFALSVVGIFLNRRNLIVLLMAIELMLLAVNMNFVAFSRFLNPAQQVRVRKADRLRIVRMKPTIEAAPPAAEKPEGVA